MITEFWDEENGGFFFTSNDHEELDRSQQGLLRQRDAVRQFGRGRCSALKLARFFGDERYERFASYRFCDWRRDRSEGFRRDLEELFPH